MSIRSANPASAGRPKALPASFALLAVLALGALVLPGGAAAKSGKRVVLGQSKSNPTPNCGVKADGRECSVEGKVTVFQGLMQGRSGRAFVVPFKRGKVVSWSIALSRPTAKETEKWGSAQMPFFNNLFGSPAKARISVLRQVDRKKKGSPRYKMVRQGPTEILNPYFGTTVRFALSKPLNVIRNQVVALTIPTWAPAFWTPKACASSKLGGLVDPVACARSKKRNSYRGSRVSGKCKLGFEAGSDEPNEALRKTRPQQKVNSVKPYGCYYRGSRLLYTATVVAP